MNLEECFEKRLLRNAPRDRLKSEKAIEMAQRAIIQAEKLKEHGFYEQVILYSYTAMFPAIYSPHLSWLRACRPHPARGEAGLVRRTSGIY